MCVCVCVCVCVSVCVCARRVLTPPVGGLTNKIQKRHLKLNMLTWSEHNLAELALTTSLYTRIQLCWLCAYYSDTDFGLVWVGLGWFGSAVSNTLTLGEAPRGLLRRWVVEVAAAVAVGRRHPACLHLLLTNSSCTLLTSIGGSEGAVSAPRSLGVPGVCVRI